MLRNWTTHTYTRNCYKVVNFYILSDKNWGVTCASSNSLLLCRRCARWSFCLRFWLLNLETLRLKSSASLCLSDETTPGQPIVTFLFSEFHSKFSCFEVTLLKLRLAAPSALPDIQTDDPCTTVKSSYHNCELFDFSKNLQETKRWVCYSDYPF
jgi:hypothetical protein